MRTSVKPEGATIFTHSQLGSSSIEIWNGEKLTKLKEGAKRVKGKRKRSPPSASPALSLGSAHNDLAVHHLLLQKDLPVFEGSVDPLDPLPSVSQQPLFADELGQLDLE